MILNYDDFLNEELFGVTKKITFPSKTEGSPRIEFKIEDIDGDKIHLKRDNEKLTIDSECNITNHYRGTAKMKMTYICDDKTKKEIKKALK